MAGETKKVYNHDIKGLYDRMNRFIEEMIKSVSSGTSQMNAFDQARLLTYLGHVRSFQAWCESQPLLDLPETAPREYVLKPEPVRPDIESDDIESIVELMCLARDEIINSQSARDPSGLNKFDSLRLKSVVDKIEKFLNEVVQVSSPLDLPESSPMTPMSGPGRSGV